MTLSLRFAQGADEFALKLKLTRIYKGFFAPSIISLNVF